MLFRTIHGFIPQSFSDSTIIPLVKDKTGDITDKNNYRPIALCTMSSKLLEKIILERYDSYFVTSSNQFGFKKSHSTDACIYGFKEIVSIYKKHSSPVFTCFLDASKAFDKINYWHLFSKLNTRGLPLFVIRLLCFWYVNQQVCVQWGNILSCPFNVSNGVKQGGILSPLFFNVYINDLSIDLTNSGIGCNINGVCLNHFIYADDMCLVAPSARALQTLLNICVKYASCHDIVYNTKKSVCMFFKSNKLTLPSVPNIYMGSSVLQYVNSYKYLGVIISEDLCDNNDIKRTIRGIYARSNMLIRKFYHCSYTVKKFLFNTYCTNFYCTQLWWSYHVAAIKKVRIAFNNSFRHFMGYSRRYSASAMFLENSVDCFDVLRRKYIHRFMCRLLKSSNLIINHIMDYKKVFVLPSMKEWLRSIYSSNVSMFLC